MQGCDETPNPRNLLTKGNPSFIPGPLPPIPWPKEAAGAKKAENPEIVEIKVKNPDTKIPTK